MSTYVWQKGVQKTLAVLLKFCTEHVNCPQMRQSLLQSALLVTMAQVRTQTTFLSQFSLLRNGRSFRQVPR